MNLYNQFKAILKKETAILMKRARQAERSALSKSMNFSRRELAKDLKIKTSELSKRASMKLPKPDGNSQSGYLWFGVVPLPASLFKPKSVKIGRGKKAKRSVVATAQGQKQSLPQSFIWTTGAGKTLALERKTAAKYPLRQSRIDALRGIVSNKFNTIKAFLLAVIFKRISIANRTCSGSHS